MNCINRVSLLVVATLVGACTNSAPNSPPRVEAPVVEAPVVKLEAPVVETPVVKLEAPIVETPVVKLEAPVVEAPSASVKLPKKHNHSNIGRHAKAKRSRKGKLSKKSPRRMKVVASAAKRSRKGKLSKKSPRRMEVVASASPLDPEIVGTKPGRNPAMQFSETTITKPGRPILEYGIAAGFPAIVNLTLTSWGTSKVPWLVKASGMYLGNRGRGIQLETGWAFYRTEEVKQYIGVEFISLEWIPSLSAFNRNFSRFSATGFGPSYGISAFGLTAQLGVYYGTYRLNFRNPTRGFNVSAQVGWTNFW